VCIYNVNVINKLQLQRFPVVHSSEEEQDLYTQARERLSGQRHLADQIAERNQTPGTHVVSTISLQGQF